MIRGMILNPEIGAPANVSFTCFFYCNTLCSCVKHENGSLPLYDRLPLCICVLDFRMVWFEAATVVPMAPPVDIPAGSVLKSALAGGLASALSTSMLHPLDTVKVRLPQWNCCHSSLPCDPCGRENSTA
jgi:hypothetical protein